MLLTFNGETERYQLVKLWPLSASVRSERSNLLFHLRVLFHLQSTRGLSHVGPKSEEQSTNELVKDMERSNGVHESEKQSDYERNENSLARDRIDSVVSFTGLAHTASVKLRATVRWLYSSLRKRIAWSAFQLGCKPAI